MTIEQTINAPMRELVSVRQVAEIFSVSPRTIQRWTEAGVFPQPVRIGLRYRRWRRADLAAFIAQLKAEKSAEKS